MTIKTYYMINHYLKLIDYKLKEQNYCCEKCSERHTDDYPLLINLKQVLCKPFDQYTVNEVDLLCRECIKSNNTLSMPQTGWELLTTLCSDNFYRCEHIKKSGCPCNQSIKYQNFLYHKDVGVKIVGSDCTAKITQDDECAALSDENQSILKAITTAAYKDIDSNYKDLKESRLDVWELKNNNKGYPYHSYSKWFSETEHRDYHSITINITKHDKSHFMTVWLSGFGNVHFKHTNSDRQTSAFLWGSEETLFNIASLIIEYRKRQARHSDLQDGFKALLRYELQKLNVKMIKGE